LGKAIKGKPRTFKKMTAVMSQAHFQT
jgi:hypothetical protein